MVFLFSISKIARFELGFMHHAKKKSVDVFNEKKNNDCSSCGRERGCIWQFNLCIIIKTNWANLSLYLKSLSTDCS